MKDANYNNLKGEREQLRMVKCPKCGHIFSDVLTCTRCKHSWRPRGEELPTVCPNPKCKSPYWNRARKKKNHKKK